VLGASPQTQVSRFETVRARTVSLCAPLSAEDAQLQSMADASPAKWHLAHTTWFFETFVLAPLGAAPVAPAFAFLFNSYYEAAGPRAARDRRGLVSRPSLADVHAYRAEVDRRTLNAIVEGRADAVVVELGLHHEQQHQELVLTDLKHALGTQPTRPAYRADLARPALEASPPITWREHAGGVIAIGADVGFAFDNERPRHRVFVEPFELASRPVSNAEVLAFIADGGYTRPELWLSDGWAIVQREGWTAPLYWELDRGELYDLAGVRAIDRAETACHLSLYEADAIARWAGARLPTEAEWEHVAAFEDPSIGHFADDDRLHPRGALELFGDVWQWTQSAYSPYPGFRPLAGALGEYNGKFMSGQTVLRGGSCFTPRGHIRASYRNFFPPHARWQMTGVRFARDARST
jgi:ergothioneine biosynthesis protein EgtB